MARTITIKGINTHFVELTPNAQGKTTLLFLHGWQGSSASWKDNVSELSLNFRCISLDLPGFEVSGTPTTIWNVTDYAAFVREFIKELNLTDVVLVGKSFGGRVAIKYASLWPNTLTALILVAAAGLETKSVVTKAKIILSKTGKSALKLFGFDDLAALRKVFYRGIGVSADTSSYKWDVKKLVTNENLTPDAEKITLPTLIVWGEDDDVLPLNVGTRLAASIEGSKFVVIPGGHNAHQTSAKQFNDLVSKFALKLNAH